MATGSRRVFVIGGGPAGCAAALEAARLGLAVTLVDEHPQSATAMSLDAPYFYGARFSPVLASARAVAERVLGANEALMACVEAGVEVLTGTCAWGVFRPGPNSLHVDGPQVGLADDKRSWCLPFDHLVLATGARDLVLSFPGWHLPGVLGVMGASKLLVSYEAFEARRVLVLGSGNAGLAFARQAVDRGLEVAGIVDPSANVMGDPVLAAELERRGIPFLPGHTIERALGAQQVEAARLSRLADGQAIDITCDTIVMAFGVVPNVELASVAGCRIAYDDARGGWAPSVDERMETSVAGIHVVGDAAGVTEAMLLDSSIAVAQGQSAAHAIAREGLPVAASDSAGARPVADSRAAFPPDSWLASLVAAGGMDVMVCQCEEVSRGELVGLQPPRYLGERAGASAESIRSAVADGLVSQDHVKRMTRAGMGHCQGKRCRDHAAMLLARAAGTPLSSVVPGSYRMPVRPLPLAVMQADDEAPGMRSRWANWLHPVDGPPSGL